MPTMLKRLGLLVMVSICGALVASTALAATMTARLERNAIYFGTQTLLVVETVAVA